MKNKSIFITVNKLNEEKYLTNQVNFLSVKNFIFINICYFLCRIVNINSVLSHFAHFSYELVDKILLSKISLFNIV